MGNDDDRQASQPETQETQDERALALIEEQADRTIRRQLYDGRLHFSVVDIVAVLTDSPNPGAYWRKLKQRLKEEENARETVTNCHTLKMTAADGKQRMTDAADTETMLRIIQSIPSPKAEPIKQWLARVGAQKLHEMTQPLPASSVSQEIAELRRNKPDDDAPPLDLADYYAALSSLYRRHALFKAQMQEMQAQMQYVDAKLEEHDDQLSEHDEQIGELHSRMESNEALLRMVPELLERLGPETLSPEHQQTVRALAKRLHEVTGESFGSIYTKLGEHFHVARYQQLPEARWFEIMQWFQQQIAAGKQQRGE